MKGAWNKVYKMEGQVRGDGVEREESGMKEESNRRFCMLLLRKTLIAFCSFLLSTNKQDWQI